MEAITQFFNDLVWFFDLGLPAILKQFLVYMGKLIIYSWIQTQVFMLDLAYTIASEILADMNVTALIESSFSNLDSESVAIANYMKIPDLVKNLISAYATRFVLGFMGW